MIEPTEPGTHQARGDALPCHLFMPEVEWPRRPVAFVNLAITYQTLDTAGDHEVPRYAHMRADDLPIGMIEPEPDHGRWAPWVFWALVSLAFGCVMLEAAGVRI